MFFKKIRYDAALVNIGGGRQKLMTDIRNNSRCIIDDEVLADKIFQRIKKYIPSEFKGKQVVSLNERLRFLRYHPGERFEPHFDGCYIRENGERTYITVQLYLNEGAKGGETRMFGDDLSVFYDVVPQTGMVLVFQHDILHSGNEVAEGVKYCMRSDVLYTA